MNLLFDLDGTLTDPREGITTCMRHALSCLGRNPDDYPNLERFIGPPLLQSFAELLGNDSDAALALRYYRERFADVGLYENQVYPGIETLLGALANAGHRMLLATAKPQVFASRIIDHFALRGYFSAVYGSELDGTRTDKSDLIAFILAAEAITASDAIMIGDRSFDIVGARNNGVRAIGVSWGYGSAEELAEAAPEALCDSPAALQALLLPRA